jgi:hypothetical protein
MIAPFDEEKSIPRYSLQFNPERIEIWNVESLDSAHVDTKQTAPPVNNPWNGHSYELPHP